MMIAACQPTRSSVTRGVISGSLFGFRELQTASPALPAFSRTRRNRCQDPYGPRRFPREHASFSPTAAPRLAVASATSAQPSVRLAIEK